MKKENHIVRGNASEHGRWCVIHCGIPRTFRVLFFSTAQCMYLSTYLPDRRLGRDRIYFSSLQGTQLNEAAVVISTRDSRHVLTVLQSFGPLFDESP
jgi:hypothetical protein